MKYRIVQYLEQQYEYSNGFKVKPVSEYMYVAQYRYNWWPFWYDMCFPQDSKEDAQIYIDATIKERSMPKIIIHDVNQHYQKDKQPLVETRGSYTPPSNAVPPLKTL